MHEEQRHEELEVEKPVVLEEESLEELIDLEEWVNAKKKPRRARSYRIRIDKEKFVVTVHEMTGTKILAPVGKTPDKYLLSQKLHGGRVEPIKPDQVVEFHRCEVVYFSPALALTSGRAIRQLTGIQRTFPKTLRFLRITSGAGRKCIGIRHRSAEEHGVPWRNLSSATGSPNACWQAPVAE